MRFYLIYTLAGITDVLDGIVARKFKLVSRFGAVFDAIADICFAGICLFKLISAIDIPLGLCIWIAMTVLIKIVNIALGFALYKTMVAEHTFMNKVMGILPFVIPIVDLENCIFREKHK